MRTTLGIEDDVLAAARALLDIHVVIALLDQGHVLHRAATLWLERELEHGWAHARSPMPTCWPWRRSMEAAS